MQCTWILVADSSRARLFSAARPTAPLEEVDSFTHPESRARIQDLTSDRHGRSNDNVSRMDFDVSPKQQEAISFAKEISRRLRDGRNAGRFQKLYIAASPAFLGLLRSNLDAHTAQMIVDQVNKDLTQLDPVAIRRHLPERL